MEKGEMRQQEDSRPQYKTTESPGRARCTIPGMDSVVVSVSGYLGSERFNLIKLINETGANYVGTFSRNASHLVCWQFQGEKYNFAKRIGVMVVNHRWFEDCLSKRRRIPEGPYTVLSGENVGPLLWRSPATSNNHAQHEGSQVHLEKKGLSDVSNIFNTKKLLEIDKRCSKVADLTFPRSVLIDELMSESNSRKGTLKSCKVAKRDLRKSDKHDDSFIGGKRSLLVPVEEWHQRSKRKANNLERNSFSVLDLTTSSNCHNEGTAWSACYSNSGLDRTKENDLVENKNQGLVIHASSFDFGASGGKSNTLSKKSCSKLSLDSTEKSEFDCEGYASANASCSKHLPAEISCAICWTEFSSTRGVLPCGHRFCYSCIQNWADRMGSERKDSVCPLCKASFVCITKVDDASSHDQKMFSQTIPCSSKTNLILLHDKEQKAEGLHLPFRCYKCASGDADDSLLRCCSCRSRWVHSFCLDPPYLGTSWTCRCCNLRRRPAYEFP